MGKFPIWWFDGFVWGIILIGMIPIGIIIYNIWLIAVLYSTYNCVSDHGIAHLAYVSQANTIVPIRQLL